MAVSMKMAVLWVVATCSLVELHHRFRVPCYLYHQDALTMEAARTPETLVNFYKPHGVTIYKTAILIYMVQ
jgi:hypothetical protein